MKESIRIFQEILNHKNGQPLVIFDLDSTLFNVSHRTQKILEAFTGDPQNSLKYPTEIAEIKKLQIRDTDWGIKEALIRIQLKSSDEFYRSIGTFWKKHFFSSTYLHHDAPYSGATNYVNELYNEGIAIKYLTGRDAPNMKTGTLASLKQHGFPFKNIDSDLIMKPYKGFLEDQEYKKNILEKLHAEFKSIWFFENEPLIIKTAETFFPKINFIWIDTTHSRRIDPPIHLPTIKNNWHVR